MTIRKDPSRKYQYTKRKLDSSPRHLSLHTCPVCGKQAYDSRLTAKQAAERSSPGTKLRLYQCGGFWHQTSTPAATMSRYRQMNYQRAVGRGQDDSTSAPGLPGRED